MSEQIRDFTDEEARRALVFKWGMVKDPSVLPAWVAEMDYAWAPAVTAAVKDAVDAGVGGYPVFRPGGELGAAYSGFAARHYGQQVDPEQVTPVSDVTAGVRVAIDVLSEPGPLVLPVPAYDPQFGVAAVCGREHILVETGPDQQDATLNVAGIDAALARGGRTVLLTQPHNPLGRAYTRAELEALREVVTRHGARVVSDEIHAPLVLSGATHVPYLSLPGTAEHAVAVVAASKAFNTAGLRCAQIITNHAPTFARLQAEPAARNDSWSPLGVVAAVAAYTDGDAWLAALIARLDAQRTLLTSLLAEHLPKARMRPLEATYLAWLDLRDYGHDDPAVPALAGGVRLSPGRIYHPGLAGHARLNIATSPARLTEIVRRLGAAL
ncbi:MAG: MalY/PatB family protein [Actinomycetales bacterium]